MKKFFSGLCISLAVILALGGLGFGGYKLFNKPKSNKPTYADDVAKIYNVDVNAFNYGLGDIENVMQDGVLVSEGINAEDLTTQDAVCSLFNKMFKNRFVYHDPNDSEAVGEVYENGVFVNTGAGTIPYYVGSPSTSSNLKFYLYYKIVDDGVVFRFSKIGNSTAGSLSNPNNTHDCFEYELEEEYLGKNVVYYNSAFWMKAYYVADEAIPESMTTTEMATYTTNMFDYIIYKTSGSKTSNLKFSYVKALSNGWHFMNYKYGQTGGIGIAVKFVNNGVYFMFCDGNNTNAPLNDYYFSDKEYTENFEDQRFDFVLANGKIATSEVVPYLSNSYFFKGFQVTSGEANYTFSNLNQAKEMLGIKDEDGAFSMTARTDAEDYTEYVFNLKTDNMSLDFKVKVYKDNVCVLDYNKYYYVDKDGNVQTFSVEDITKENSPFVYFYETQTDYYYLRRVDVLTSYQLKISKDILNLTK